MVPIEAMKNKICILISMLTVGAVASTLLEETFETSTIGSISGQNSWVLESGTGDVQTNKVNSGAQALKIQSGSVSHALSSTESEVWTRFQVFVEDAPDTDPVVTAANTSVAFFINTNLTLTVYSNTTPVALSESVATNAWTRFDVYCDYSNMTWNLSMNGTTVSAGLPLYSSNAQVEEVLIANNSTSPVYIDEINILDQELTTDSPDIDSDGIPDWWGTKIFWKHHGLLTNHRYRKRNALLPRCIYCRPKSGYRTNPSLQPHQASTASHGSQNPADSMMCCGLQA